MFTRPIPRFLLKLALMTLLIGVSCLAYFTAFADGRTDAYYLRFTSDSQSSLILGTSRGARGLRPSVFNERDLVFEGPLYNYAFTASWSPYGSTYLDAVRRKLDPSTTDGLFILEVSPLGLTAAKDVVDAPGDFRETALPLGILRLFNQPVNLDYLLRAYTDSYYRILLEYRFQRDRTLYPNGWLEFDYNFSPETVERLTERTVSRYDEYFATQEFSATRLESLAETIRFLQQHGRVVLVRLPIAPEMLTLETDVYPEFDAQMQTLADQHDIPYLNFTLAPAGRYTTQDGHHLDVAASEQLSRDIVFALR